MQWDFFTVHGVVGRRWGWWSVVPITVFWLLLWPVGVVWFVVSGVRRHRALDTSVEARAARRTTRYLSWYPASWRERHGEDFADTVESVMRDGRAGPALTANVIWESGLERTRTQPTGADALLWSVCWLPLVAQGLAPMIVKLAGGDVRALFVALYLPDAYQWPFMVVMVVLGLGLLAAAIRSTTSAATAKAGAGGGQWVARG